MRNTIGSKRDDELCAEASAMLRCRRAACLSYSDAAGCFGWHFKMEDRVLQEVKSGDGMRWLVPGSSRPMPKVGNWFYPCNAIQSLKAPDCGWYGQSGPWESSQTNTFQCDYQAYRPWWWQQWCMLLRCQEWPVMIAVTTCSQIQTCTWNSFWRVYRLRWKPYNS